VTVRPLSAVGPLYAERVGIPGCMLGLCENLSTAFDVTVWAIGGTSDVRALPFVRLAMPSIAYRAACKLGVSDAVVLSVLKQRFLGALPPGAAAWVWPGMGVEFLRELRRRGHPVILERINSHVASARELLESVWLRHGFAPNHDLDEGLARTEEMELELADFVFVCSPFVAASFERAGVPAARLLRSTYGWDPARFVLPERRRDPAEIPTFLFVGTDMIRKGVPELLESWHRSGVRAKLRIIGEVDRQIRERYGHLLSGAGIELLGYQRDLARAYADADVFVLPSHEEGSPLVTYLALAAGIPSLVSFAGAGGVIADGVEGFVREPSDQEGLVDALRRLAENASLRQEMGRAARAASVRYTWQAVAERRSADLERVLSARHD